MSNYTFLWFSFDFWMVGVVYSRGILNGSTLLWSAHLVVVAYFGPKTFPVCTMFSPIDCYSGTVISKVSNNFLACDWTCQLSLFFVVWKQDTDNLDNEQNREWGDFPLSSQTRTNLISKQPNCYLHESEPSQNQKSNLGGLTDIWRTKAYCLIIWSCSLGNDVLIVNAWFYELHKTDFYLFISWCICQYVLQHVRKQSAE